MKNQNAANEIKGLAMRMQRWFHGLSHFSRLLFRRRKLDQELNDEIAYHIEAKTEENIAKGMPPEEARRTARMELGGVEQVKEKIRSVRTGAWFEIFFRDVRFGLRMLRKNPTVSVVSVVSLALGIGATTAILSVAYGVLLKPFPYRGSDRMVVLNVSSVSGVMPVGLSAPEFEALRHATALDGASLEDDFDMVTTSGGLPQAVAAVRFSGNAFSFFGVPPLLGREFTEADAPEWGQPRRVVVLSYHFWRTHYGGRDDVLGKPLELDDQDYRVIGRTPATVQLERRGRLRTAGNCPRSEPIVFRGRPPEGRDNADDCRCDAPAFVRSLCGENTGPLPAQIRSRFGQPERCLCW